jgi:hypothetical protein
MAVAEITNLIIEKGTDFEYDFQLFDENGEFINLENCQVIAKIKKYPGAKLFNTFDVSFLDRSQGIIRLLMSNSSTVFLSEGRNWFDVAVIYPNTKVKLVMKGTIIVEETAISLISYEKTIGDLKKVDTSTADDGEVLIFDQQKQELEFVNPDEVLSEDPNIDFGNY